MSWTRKEALAILDREKRTTACSGDCGKNQLPRQIRNYYEWRNAQRPVAWKPVAVAECGPELDRTSDAYIIAHLRNCSHEVGHAVTCLHEGGRVTRLWADGPLGGVCDCDFGTMSDFSQALVSMGGAVAANLSRGLGSHDAQFDKPHVIEELRRHGVRGSDSQVLDYAFRCESAVEDILSRRWRFVKAAKAMLFKHRELSGAQVHELWDLYA